MFGFSDFEIFDSRDVPSLQNMFENYVGEISRNKDKVSWKDPGQNVILNAIYATLKCQPTVKC